MKKIGMLYQLNNGRIMESVAISKGNYPIKGKILDWELYKENYTFGTVSYNGSSSWSLYKGIRDVMPYNDNHPFFIKKTLGHKTDYPEYYL